MNVYCKLKKNKFVVYIFLLIAGMVLSAALIYPHYALPETDFTQEQIYVMYMSSRYDWISDVVEQLENGEYLSAVTQRQNFSASFILIFALPAYIFKIPLWLSIWCIQFSFLIFALGIIPALFYRLFNEKYIWLSLFSLVPLKTFVTIYLLNYANESYWMFGWIVLVSLPVLIIFAKEKWGKLSWLWIGLTATFISIANAIRGQGGTGVLMLLLLIAAIKLFYKTTDKKMLLKRGLTFLTVVIVAMVSSSFLSQTLPEFIGWATGRYGRFQYTEPWHTLYIGVNDYEDRYGIYYYDGCSLYKAQEIKPDVVYESEEYYSIMKEQYFKVWKDDPGYVFWGYIHKMYAGIIYWGTLYVSWAFPFEVPFLTKMAALTLAPLTIVFVFGTFKDYFKKYWLHLVISVLMFGTAMFQPMVAIFRGEYIPGMIAGLGMLNIIYILSALICVWEKWAPQVKAKLVADKN